MCMLKGEGDVQMCYQYYLVDTENSMKTEFDVSHLTKLANDFRNCLAALSFMQNTPTTIPITA